MGSDGRKSHQKDSTLEDLTDDGDIMYENVIGPQPVREKRPPPAPPAPAMGRGRQLMAGLRKCSLHLSLIFLLLCLVLCAAVIGLTMKYVQKSSDFQTLVTDHQTMSNSMTLSLRSGDDLLKSLRIDLATTKTELEKTRLELRKMEQNNGRLMSSLKSKEGLLESANKDLTTTKNELEKTRSELEKASRSNTDLKKSLQECRDEQKSTAKERTSYLSKLEKCKQDNRDICPGGWERFGKKCLWFSEEKKSWKNSEDDCKERTSNLIIVQYYDQNLKDFIKEKQGNFWVGKEWNKRRRDWEWPENYSKYGTWNAYRISDGRVEGSYSSYTNRWICEKNIVLATADHVCHRSDSV